MTAQHNSKQHALDLLTTSQHVQLLHGQHDDDVFIATMPEGGQWKNKLVKNELAAFVADSVVSFSSHSYISQAGFKKGATKKNAANVTTLPCFYVDLDYYNIQELNHLSPTDLLHYIQKKEPWLPLPTMIADSGRGAYFIWLLDSPLDVSQTANGVKRYAQWQTVQDQVTTFLHQYGGDPACKDSSRVLRIAGSSNVKATLERQRVKYWDTGNTVTLKTMHKAVTSHQEEIFTESPAKPVLEMVVNNKGSVKKTVKQPVKTVKGAVTTITSGYSLNLARASDYRTLATLRGGNLDDFRHRFLFCYAVAIAWTCPTPEKMQSELMTFASDYFKQGKRGYSARRLKSRVKSVVDRFRDFLEGKLHTWNKVDPDTGEVTSIEVDPRYKLTNKTIKEMLQITAEEEMQLLTIISPTEKKERKCRAMEKARRTKGIKPRDEYLEAANKNRQMALQLFEDGMNKSQIARELNLSRGAVRNYLK